MTLRPSRYCASGDDCGLPAGHGATERFCADHAAELAAIRDRVGQKPAAYADRPAVAPRPKVDHEADARAIVGAIQARGDWASVADVLADTGLSFSRYQAGARIARERGLLRSASNKITTTPGDDARGADRVPVAERAAALARLVWERGRIARNDAAAALGVRPDGGLPRAVQYAKAAGWLAKDGNAYVPGEVEPAQAEAAA